MEETRDPTGRREFVTLAGGVLTSATLAGETRSANPRLYRFVASAAGVWKVTSQTTVTGDALPRTERILVQTGADPAAADARWTLSGVTSNERYVTRPERSELVARQAPLGRANATRAALIPIRKSAAWWALTQDERREIFEAQSRHIEVGLRYLPAIARRLHHCRDLATPEPFDFITRFDFAADSASAFDEMLAIMRASDEWRFVDREVDLRLTRE